MEGSAGHEGFGVRGPLDASAALVGDVQMWSHYVACKLPIRPGT